MATEARRCGVASSSWAWPNGASRYTRPAKVRWPAGHEHEHGTLGHGYPFPFQRQAGTVTVGCSPFPACACACACACARARPAHILHITSAYFFFKKKAVLQHITSDVCSALQFSFLMVNNGTLNFLQSTRHIGNIIRFIRRPAYQQDLSTAFVLLRKLRNRAFFNPLIFSCSPPM